MAKTSFDRDFSRAGIWNWECENINDEVEYARYAEEQGLDSVWQGESRLARDAISVLGAYSQVTDEIDLATGVVNCYTRNVALMGQTFSTLDELATNRIKIGIGAWWDPLAEKVGIHRERPLRDIWEYCTILRQLLDMETVDYEGQQLHVDDIQLDVLYRDKEPIDVPIYIGATRPTMHKLSGELAAKGVVRGVFKDYLIPPEENLKGMEKLQEGVEKHGGSLSDVDSPQLIAVSMDEDRQTAIDQAKRLVTQYIGEQPPIREASGIDPEKGKLIEEEIGPWPVDQSDVERATKHVDDEIVTNVVAAGTPDEVVSRIRDYCETGCTEPVVYSIGDNVKEVIDVVAEAKSD